MSKSLNPIGTIGVFKPVYLEDVNKVDEKDGKYCKVLEASFWNDSEGEYGELLVEFLDSLERWTIGIDEFVVV